MKRKYIIPTVTAVKIETASIIAMSIAIGGDGDSRNEDAGQLVRGEQKLQPFSTHLWDDDK